LQCHFTAIPSFDKDLMIKTRQGPDMKTIQLDETLQRSYLQLGISALNGLAGDSFREKNSPLATTMGFYHQNQRLALTQETFHRLSPAASNKIVILVHGLSSHEQMWGFPTPKSTPSLESVEPTEADASAAARDYGNLLARDFGYTPFYLRYNSGLHIAENGQYLSSLIEELIACYPLEIEDITLIGHSLGGLVIRSACHYGGLGTALKQQDDHQQSGNGSSSNWTDKVKQAFYLGTPHLGTSWEEATDGLFQRLTRSENPLAKKVAGVYQARSSALRDLRYPYLTEEEWQSETPSSLPWLESAEHYFIVGTLLKNPSHPINHLVGDILVPITSAHGECTLNKSMPRPPKAAENAAVIAGINHLRLAHSAEVYEAIKGFMAR
jgi:pimeloyl-ACP methyl ester carboxylesterase